MCAASGEALSHTSTASVAYNEGYRRVPSRAARQLNSLRLQKIKIFTAWPAHSFVWCGFRILQLLYCYSHVHGNSSNECTLICIHTAHSKINRAWKSHKRSCRVSKNWKSTLTICKVCSYCCCASWHCNSRALPLFWIFILSRSLSQLHFSSVSSFSRCRMQTTECLEQWQ